jgi:ATP-dependent exoDNAse (exonuclease V) alpha subunit
VRGLLADRNGVAVLIAPAGAGKTTSIAVARAGWEAAGLKVEGCAPTAKAAAELGDRGGMPTHTCAQVLAYEQRKAGMPAGGVMVIDEAGMLGTRDLARLLKAADDSHTKAVLVGDAGQLQPISAGGLFRGIAAQVGAQELTANRRQQQGWQREMLGDVRRGDGAKAVDRLVGAGQVMVADSQPGAWAACTADWWRVARDNPTGAQMLARTNEDVRALNQYARQIVEAEGRLSGPVVSNRFADFQAGDRIECRNTSALSRKHGVANRDIGVVRAVEGGGLVVDLDREAQVRLPAAYLPHVQHGYAVTCHGVQGATYDQTFVLGAGSREWTYTALSRHREDVHMYLSAGQSDDGELDLPRQLRDALGTARRAAAGSEAKPAAVELAPRTQSDAELRAEIEHTAETLRTRPAYAKAMPDGTERLAKRNGWDVEHAPELARGVSAGEELRWRQGAKRVAAEAEAPEVKAPKISGPVLERSA